MIFFFLGAGCLRVPVNREFTVFSWLEFAVDPAVNTCCLLLFCKIRYYGLSSWMFSTFSFDGLKHSLLVHLYYFLSVSIPNIGFNL